MPIVPVRGVGQVGVITDLNPYDTPINAASEARNIRFSDNNFSRAPVFKIPGGTIPDREHVAVFCDQLQGADNYVVLVDPQSGLWEMRDGQITEVSAPNKGAAQEQQITTVVHGGVSYLNDGVNRPCSRTDLGASFVPVTGWAENDRCVSLRAFKDYLIAVNIKKGAVEYPSMVKWSDAAQYGQMPSWDTAADSSLAGENVLPDCIGGLVDGLELGPSFMIYGDRDVYRMDYIGAPFVFSFDKIFSAAGMIAPNCVVEHNSTHFVFGPDDIYVHDGTSKKSIVSARVRERIYRRLDLANRRRFHVVHNASDSEVIFCYRAKGSIPAYDISEVGGCNEAAVYNYAAGTWSFLDLPNVMGHSWTTPTNNVTWADMATWREVDSSWESYEAVPARALLFLTGPVLGETVSRLALYDNLQNGRLSNEVYDDLLFDGVAEFRYKDLDEMGVTLSDSKMIRALYPQVYTVDPEHAVGIRLGQSRHPRGEIQWGVSQDFRPALHLKHDSRVNGRYLTVRFSIIGDAWAEISGYDMDVIPIAKR